LPNNDPDHQSATIGLRSADGKDLGTLSISVLPTSRSNPGALLDLRSEPDLDPAVEPIQLLEGLEYRFVFDLLGPRKMVTTDHPEIFTADESTGKTGRIRPGTHVGTLPVEITIDGATAHIALEVRSRKLDYLTQYRWMLRDIADALVEAIMERFAATQQRFALDETTDARTLYQRFAFLKSLWKDEPFVSALQFVVNRPYVAWIEVSETRSLSKGVRGSSRLMRQLSRPGEKILVPAVGQHLPLILDDIRPEETVNNPPNQFVKWVLSKWRDDVLTVATLLADESPSAPVKRGLRETSALLSELDIFLASPFFFDVDHLTAIPSANPTLLKKAGYREIARAFVQSEMAAALGWQGGENVYGAGQRDIATLYEYWTFMQVAQCLSSLSDTKINFGELLETAGNGLNLTLAKGKRSVLKTSISRLGSEIVCELWFNRSFTQSNKAGGSWTRPMRPDCSLLLLPKGVARHDHRAIWVHFDAKYRAENLTDVLGDVENEEDLNKDSNARRDDLLKMHAYRDAIRRSAGAYILYPGASPEYCREYHELLPGLGAFALRPSADGDADGLTALRDFLNNVITHAASQLSQHERERYWSATSYGGNQYQTRNVAAFLQRPAADTRVLIGFVRTEKQLRWIKERQLYNLRADDRNGSVQLEGPELSASFVLLYGPSIPDPILVKVDGTPRILDRQDMLNNGYEQPGGRLYFCLPIAELETEWSSSLTSDEVRRLVSNDQPQRGWGSPVVLTWDRVFGHS
jgi:predicted component of viral defense system (DUF524 family)